MRPLVLLVLALMSSGCASTASQLHGSWVLVESQGDQLRPESPPGSHDAVKTLGDTHFAFGRLDEFGDVFGGGGTWSYEDGVYVERVRYHTHDALVGEVIEFRCRLEGDLWYHEGRFEAGSRQYQIREVWKRLREAEPES